MSAHVCHPTAQLQYLPFFLLREYRHACDVDPTISTPDLAPVLVALGAGSPRCGHGWGPMPLCSGEQVRSKGSLPCQGDAWPPHHFLLHLSSLISKMNEKALLCSASVCLPQCVRQQSRERPHEWRRPSVHSSSSFPTMTQSLPAGACHAGRLCPCTRACTSQIPHAVPFIPSFPTVAYAPPAGHRPPLVPSPLPTRHNTFAYIHGGALCELMVVVPSGANVLVQI